MTSFLVFLERQLISRIRYGAARLWTEAKGRAPRRPPFVYVVYTGVNVRFCYTGGADMASLDAPNELPPHRLCAAMKHHDTASQRLTLQRSASGVWHVVQRDHLPETVATPVRAPGDALDIPRSAAPDGK